MRELIAFYSYSGKTRALAQHLAQQRGADTCEVCFAKKPSLARTFLLCPAAMGQKKAKIQPIEADFGAYDKITIMGPVWAACPAPPVNNIIARLPAGMQVEVILVSGSGSSNRKKVTALIERQGCTITDYQDVASGEPPKPSTA